MPYKFVLIICALSFCACKDKQAKVPKVEQVQKETTDLMKSSTNIAKKVILCFGNSLTAGYGLDEQEAWPNLLQKRLDSLKFDYTVVNAGLSGETTSGGLNRIDWVLKQKVDVFILELGANDMLRGLSVEETEKNLNGIIAKLKIKFPDIPIVIAGMLAPPNMGEEYSKGFNKIFQKIATKNGAGFIPFLLESVAGIEALNLADGKHPNAEGQKIVLENVWTSISSMLKK